MSFFPVYNTHPTHSHTFPHTLTHSPTQTQWGTVWEMHNTPRSTVVRFRITNDSNAVRVTTWLTIAAGRFRSTGTQFWGRALSGITYGAPTWTQCRDVPPDSSATCAQQKSWGQCSQPWMKQPIPTQWGYCAVCRVGCCYCCILLLQSVFVPREFILTHHTLCIYPPTSYMYPPHIVPTTHCMSPPHIVCPHHTAYMWPMLPLWTQAPGQRTRDHQHHIRA